MNGKAWIIFNFLPFFQHEFSFPYPGNTASAIAFQTFYLQDATLLNDSELLPDLHAVIRTHIQNDFFITDFQTDWV